MCNKGFFASAKIQHNRGIFERRYLNKDNALEKEHGFSVWADCPCNFDFRKTGKVI